MFAFAVFITCWTVRGAPGFTRDSVSYLAAAQSLAAGLGLIDYDGEPYRHWPPLYPALLALAGDGARGAVAVNAGALGLLVCAAGLYFGRAGVSRGFAATGLVALMAAGPLVRVAGHVWSEAVFALLVVAPALLVGARLPGLVIALALAGLQRYAGVAAALAAGAALFAHGQRWRGALVAVLGAAPALLWLALHPATRPAPQVAATDHLRGGLATLAGWVSPAPLPEGLVVAGVLLVLASIAYGAWRRRVLGLTYLVLFVPSYLAVMTAASQGVHINQLDDRYLSPLWAPVVIALVHAADGPHAWARAAVLAGLLVPASLRVEAPRGDVRADDDLSLKLVELPADVRIFSNAPWLVWLATNRRTPALPRSKSEADSMAAAMEEAPVAVVWWGPLNRVQLDVAPGLEPRLRFDWHYRGKSGGICAVAAKHVTREGR